MGNPSSSIDEGLGRVLAVHERSEVGLDRRPRSCSWRHHRRDMRGRRAIPRAEGNRIARVGGRQWPRRSGCQHPARWSNRAPAAPIGQAGAVTPIRRVLVLAPMAMELKPIVKRLGARPSDGGRDQGLRGSSGLGRDHRLPDRGRARRWPPRPPSACSISSPSTTSWSAASPAGSIPTSTIGTVIVPEVVLDVKSGREYRPSPAGRDGHGREGRHGGRAHRGSVPPGPAGRVRASSPSRWSRPGWARSARAGACRGPSSG